MSEPATDDYVTISKSSFSDVVLPTVDHVGFAQDRKAQHALLALLYEKLAIEHRTSNHQLFLDLDPDRQGVLGPTQFRQALADVGVPLTAEQLEWLVQSFDLNRDQGLDYSEFVRLLGASRAGKVGGAATGVGKTGLEWGGSPFQVMDEAREERKRLVLARYAEMLHAAAAKAVMEDASATTSTSTGTQTTTTTTTEEEAVVQAVLLRLAGVVFEKLGGLKRGFRHVDGDGDNMISAADLAHCLEHHLGLVLPEHEFQALFKTLDFEGSGTIHYHEWIRVMAKYAEATEGGAAPHNWSPAAALAATPAKKPEAVEGKLKVEVVEGDETAGLGFEDAAVRAADDAVLRAAAEALHEKGIHAHSLVKTLLPDCVGGKVDVGSLRALFGKLGVEVDEARARRFVARADLMGSGAIVSWELVRLISSAAAKEE